MKAITDPSMLQEKVVRYIEHALIERFYAHHFYEEALNRWIACTWEGLLGYAPLIHANTRGYITFVFLPTKNYEIIDMD